MVDDEGPGIDVGPSGSEEPPPPGMEEEETPPDQVPKHISGQDRKIAEGRNYASLNGFPLISMEYLRQAFNRNPKRHPVTGKVLTEVEEAAIDAYLRRHPPPAERKLPLEPWKFSFGPFAVGSDGQRTWCAPWPHSPPSDSLKQPQLPQPLEEDCRHSEKRDRSASPPMESLPAKDTDGSEEDRRQAKKQRNGPKHEKEAALECERPRPASIAPEPVAVLR